MNVSEGDALIKQLDTLFEKIRAFPFPALVEVDLDDDGEKYKALRCPRCDGIVDPEALAAVDYALRWNEADEVDSDDAFDHHRATFSSDERGEFGETVYYLHNQDHAVSLPDGWTEEWN